MDTCILCKSSKKDDVQYGEFLKSQHFGVHTFCLYLSSNLLQNGKDGEGLLGFMEDDIEKEVRRISSLKCFYCCKKYANIGCCHKKCRRTFHLICGIEHNVQNQFRHDFRSFCHKHVQNLSERPSGDETCLICYENLVSEKKKFKHVNMILAPCCRNGWFHKICLQKFAKTAGYFFKCPLCNNANTFREKLPSRGIFIPHQDAAWELEPNAYAELFERPNKCAAQQCKNKKGRTATSNNNKFVMCTACGSTAMHSKCLPIGRNIFHCDDCKIASEEGDSGRESMYSNVNHDDEDESVDICNVDDKDLDVINRLGSRNRDNIRDSGLQHDVNVISDEEMPQTSRNSNNNRNRLERCRKITDSDQDDVIKPAAVKRKKRLRINSYDSISKIIIDTESSDDTLSINTIKFKRNSINRRTKFESDSSEHENNIVVHSEKMCSKNTKPDNKSLQATDNMDGKRNIKNTTELNTNNRVKQHTQSSAKEAYLTSSSEEGNYTNVLTDPKFKKSTLYSKSNECNLPIEILESDEDEDPLEDFYKHVKIKNDYINSKVITEKGNKIFGEIKCKKEISEADKNICEKRTKNNTVAHLNSDENHTEKDIIAKRTRRKTICNNRDYGQNKMIKGVSLDISCIAARTRRKTICAESEYGKASFCANSQIFEKIHQSDEDDDSDCDLDSFLVDGNVSANNEISCIANRTRRRKSIRSIVEL